MSAVTTKVTPLRAYARYVALATGVTYGLARQAYLTRSEAAKLKLKQEADAENVQLALIQKARDSYAKLTTPPPSKEGIVSDMSDPNFDLEKYIEHVAK